MHYSHDGYSNAQEFRESILVPALQRGDFVILNMRGLLDEEQGFIDEAFGRLAESFPAAEIFQHLQIDCPDNVLLSRQILHSIDEHERQRISVEPGNRISDVTPVVKSTPPKER